MLRKFVTCLFMLLLLPAVADAQQKTMNRAADPIIVKGAKLQSLGGFPVGNIGAFAWVGQKLEPIPFQIDQLNEKGSLVFPNGPSKSADPDPSFDANDELLFMVSDCGDKALAGDMPADAKAAVELKLTDPADGGAGWVYVIGFDAPAPRSAVDYVRYDPVGNMIHAKNYTMGFSKKAPIAIGRLSLTPEGGGDNTNQVDRLKVRFSARVLGGMVTIDKNEDGFTSKVIAWIDGPVRIVRRTKNRQTLFWKIPTPSAILDNIYYYNIFEFPTRVDLPFDVDTFLSEPRFRVSTDSLCSIPGRVYLNEKNPKPVKIDGTMSPEEKSLDKSPYKWMVVAQTGKNKGAWMNRLLYEKDKTPAVPMLYYNDDMTRADGPEEEQGECGDVGYELQNLEKVGKGVLRLTSVMYNIPDYEQSKIQTYLNILDRPVRVTASVVK